ncbi:hypothetical protein [Microbacterium sp. CFBP9034]|uniref:hypothetical protein n=1 Tax=Microbacterium sp. CFBP9034 TaxID=3096540 RepID=UPI002A6A12A5|nr:hypothetical protein [Microbacterium sp. CFBP9034]MDY0908377.1 hypothetical protein [Microbacterium sp. CFBP9034]
MRSPVGDHELRQLEGNPEDLWTRGDTLVKLGITMAKTATALGDIADSDVCKSKGTDKLAEMADEAADDLAQAAVRYEDTGRVIRTYADALGTAKTWISNNQATVEKAERDYQSARDARESADDDLSSVETVWVWEQEPSRSEVSAAETAASNAATAETNALTHRDDLWGQFDHTFETWETAYEDAVGGIQKAMDSADNNDGFWEGLDNFLEVLGWVIIALTVIALIIGAPLTGLIGGIIFALTLLVVALNALKFFAGKGTLSDLLLSAVGLLPFGIGKILSKGAPALSAVIQNGRGVVTGVIRGGLPRWNLFRPTTWATPFQWLRAPSQARGGLPVPGGIVNPFRTMALGDARLVQVENFLGTMRTSPWGAAQPVQQFITQTQGAMPALWTQAVNVGVWGASFGFDLTQSLEPVTGFQFEIPGANEVRIR